MAMARLLRRAPLALVLLGGFMVLFAAVEAEPETPDEEEQEETSCQGAFDLYFVLDK